MLRMQAYASGPAGLSPLHLAALLQDQGACARSLVRADTGMAHAWVSSQAEDGKTPQDFAQLAGAADLLEHDAPWQPLQDVEQRRAPARDTRSQDNFLQSHTHQPTASHCSDAFPALAWQQTGCKRQRVALGEESEAVRTDGSSQQPQQRFGHWSGQERQIKVATTISSRRRSSAMPLASSQGFAPNGPLQHSAPGAAAFGEVQKPHWHLSSSEYQADSLEGWDAVFSEDESLAATHLELPCSDSEHSPLRAAFTLRDS